MEQNKKQILTYKSLESVTAQVLVHAVNGLGWTDFLHDLVELINNDSSLNNLSEQFDKNNSTFLFPNKKNSEDKTVKNFILINFFKGIGNMGLQSVDATFLPFITAAFILTPLKTTGGYAIAAWSEEFQKQKEVQRNINEKLDYNTKSKIVVAPLTKLLLPLVAFRNTEKRLGKKKYKTEEEKNILSRSRAMIKDYLIGLHVISFGIDVIESAEFSNFLKNAFSTLASDGLETFNNLGLIEGEVLVNYCDSPKNLLLRENMISQKDIDDLESLLIQPFVQANLFYNNVIRGKFKNDNFDLWQLIKEIEFEYTQEFSLNLKANRISSIIAAFRRRLNIQEELNVQEKSKPKTSFAKLPETFKEIVELLHSPSTIIILRSYDPEQDNLNDDEKFRQNKDNDPKASLTDYFVLALEFVFNYIWVCFMVTENTLINLIKS